MPNLIIHDFEIYLAFFAVVVAPLLGLLVVWVIEADHNSPDYKAWSAAYDEHLGLHAIGTYDADFARAHLPAPSAGDDAKPENQRDPYEPDAAVDDGNEPLLIALERIDKLERANTKLSGHLASAEAELNKALVAIPRLEDQLAKLAADGWRVNDENRDLKRRLANAQRLINRYKQAGAKPYRKKG